MGAEYPYFSCLDVPRATHPLLSSAAEKVHWAEIHLEALQRNIWDYFGTPGNRPKLRADLDPETGYHVFRVKSLPDYSRLSTDMGLAIGDVIGNIRASLDHTIWHIVEPRAVGQPGFDDRAQRSIAFPIEDDEGRLNRSAAGKTIKPYLSRDEWDVVRLALLDQPYPGAEGVYVRNRWGRWDSGHDHPLRLLKMMSNDDKHRLLATVFLLPTAMAFPLLGPIATRQAQIGNDLLAVNVGGQQANTPGEVVEVPDTHSAPYGTPVALNTDVYWARYLGEVKPNIDDAGEITPQVTFDDHVAVVHTLNRIACFVKFLLGEFERVLPAVP